MQAIPKQLTDEEWEAFGFPSDEPCDICGWKTEGGNKMESRFLYTTCRSHAGVAPVLRHVVREALQKRSK